MACDEGHIACIAISQGIAKVEAMATVGGQPWQNAEVGASG
jgi:hypothetical protein